MHKQRKFLPLPPGDTKDQTWPSTGSKHASVLGFGAGMGGKQFLLLGAFANCPALHHTCLYRTANEPPHHALFKADASTVFIIIFLHTCCQQQSICQVQFSRQPAPSPKKKMWRSPECGTEKLAWCLIDKGLPVRQPPIPTRYPRLRILKTARWNGVCASTAD